MSESELSRMGGEYTRLRVLPGQDTIVLVENKNIIKIMPPKPIREKLIAKLHMSGIWKEV